MTWNSNGSWTFAPGERELAEKEMDDASMMADLEFGMARLLYRERLSLSEQVATGELRWGGSKAKLIELLTNRALAHGKKGDK
jgi:hypothetical protein